MSRKSLDLVDPPGLERQGYRNPSDLLDEVDWAGDLEIEGLWEEDGELRRRRKWRWWSKWWLEGKDRFEERRRKRKEERRWGCWKSKREKLVRLLLLLELPTS